MLFKGLQFRKTSKVVELPRDHWEGEYQGYVAFGRICEKDHPEAVKTDYTLTSTGERIYARPIKAKGYSLTNYMYGADGYSYLMHGGKIYIRKTKPAAKKETHCDKVYNFEGEYFRPLFSETEFCKDFVEEMQGLDEKQARRYTLNVARTLISSLKLDTTIAFNNHRSRSCYKFYEDRISITPTRLDRPQGLLYTILHEIAHALEWKFYDECDNNESDGEIHGSLFVHLLIIVLSHFTDLQASTLYDLARQGSIPVDIQSKLNNGQTMGINDKYPLQAIIEPQKTKSTANG